MVDIYNILNPCKGANEESVLLMLRRALLDGIRGEHLVTGDLNLYHHEWGGDAVKAEADTYKPIVIMEELKLKRTSLRGVINWGRPNRKHNRVGICYAAI